MPLFLRDGSYQLGKDPHSKKGYTSSDSCQISSKQAPLPFAKTGAPQDSVVTEA